MSFFEALVAPFTNEGLFVEMLLFLGIFVLLGVSMNLVMGYAGLFQLGHIGFFALGALGTTFAVHPGHLGLDMFAGILLGFLFTSAAVIVIGLPTLRLKGDYFAIATFGFTLSVQAILIGYWATGIFGVPSPNPLGCDVSCIAGTRVGEWVGTAVATLFGITQSSSPARVGIRLLIMGIFAVGVYLLLGRLVNSPFGRTLKSVREDPRAAMSMGKNVQMLRFKALWISALVQSLAGSLWTHHAQSLSPQFFGFEFLILTVLALILGGLGSHVGAMLGAVVFVVFNEVSKSLATWAGGVYDIGSLSFASMRLMLFGALFVALMVLRPQGIMGDHEVTLRGLLRDGWAWLRRRTAGRQKQ